MLANKANPQGLQPTVSAGIGRPESLCGSQGDAGATSPVVHVLDITGENDLCSRPRRHCAVGGEEENGCDYEFREKGGKGA